MTQMEGPRLPPAAGGAPKQLVVFIHGYGADGNDLIGLGREWARMLPHAAFVSPNAPEPCGMAPMGRQWFDLTFRDPGEMLRGVKKAGPILDAFLDAELKRLDLPPQALALVGFSQGTMVALAVRPQALAGAGRHCRLFRRACRRRGPCQPRRLRARHPPRAWRHGRRHSAGCDAHRQGAIGASRPSGGMACRERHRPRHRPNGIAAWRGLSETGLRATIPTRGRLVLNYS